MAKPWIGYVRLSTDEQADTNALRNQIERLKEAGAEQVFHDVESGREPDRHQFKQVLDLVVNREVEGLIATRWDRLMRSYDMYLYIKEAIRKSGVQLRLLDQGDVDLQTASGELYADLQAIFSVQEVRELRQRVKRGYQKRRDRNAACAKAPWGYITVDEKYEPDNAPIAWCALIHRPPNYRELYDEPEDSVRLVKITRAQIAREVFDVVLETRSSARALNYLRQEYNLQRNGELIPPELQDFPSSDTGFRRWLDNPVFYGHTAYNKFKSEGKRGRKAVEEWDIRHDTHQGILSKEEADEIQQILFTNRKKSTPIQKTSYLAGLVFCGKCHTVCSLKKNARLKYYGCQHSSTTCANRGCVPLRSIEKAIVQSITQKAWKIAKEGSYAKSDVLIQLEQQYQKLLDMGVDSSPYLQKAKEDLERKIEQETNREDWVAKRILMHPQSQKINFWYTLTQEERHIFYAKLVERIVIQAKQVQSVVLKV